MSVDFQHPQYTEHLPNWIKVDDVCSGSKAVKAKGIEYLIRNNPQDMSAEADLAYDNYLQRAVFYGLTGATLISNVGAAFTVEPKCVMPKEYEYLKKNADAAGHSIYQLAQKSVMYCLKHYGCGMYVDYPNVPAAATREEELKRNVKATFNIVPRINITNWMESIDENGEIITTLVVMSEVYQVKGKDGFSFEEKQQFRVLSLVDGVYTVSVWRQVEKKQATGTVTKGKFTWELLESYTPTNAKGENWKQIPWRFIGSVENTSHIGNAPLLEMAEINLAHYNSSAQFEDSVYFTGQPQFAMIGVDPLQQEAMEKNGMYIGSSEMIALPTGGNLICVQAQPNTLAKDSMKTKEDLIVAIGARLTQPGSAVKTATQVESEQGIQHSILSLIVSNVNEAFNDGLNFIKQFMQRNWETVSEEDFKFEISQEFTKRGFDIEILRLLCEKESEGKISMDTVWEYVQTGIVPKHAYIEEISKIDQAGFNLIGSLPPGNQNTPTKDDNDNPAIEE